MLAHGLAIALWLGSVALYGAAFFFPEVHRRHDFFWSGVAAFYGLVLWFDAVQISTTELLGHGASLALLGWFGWQTLSLRRKRTPLDLQTPFSSDSWPTFGRHLQQVVLDTLRTTPLRRWLPEGLDNAPPVDPSLATAKIRASSLKDVDYEFVDELEPTPYPAASPAALGKTSATTPQRDVTPPPSPQRPGRPVPPVAPPPPSAAIPKPRGMSFGTRLAGLKAWLGDVMKARTTPKPKREVIEIPPRPSPLGRKQPKREVIDIPPRPSPLDRKRPQAEAEDTPPPETVTIVDTAAVKSEAIAPKSSPQPTTTTPPPDPDSTASEHCADPQATPPESNWDDDDSNWLDD